MRCRISKAWVSTWTPNSDPFWLTLIDLSRTSNWCNWRTARLCFSSENGKIRKFYNLLIFGFIALCGCKVRTVKSKLFWNLHRLCVTLVGSHILVVLSKQETQPHLLNSRQLRINSMWQLTRLTWCAPFPGRWCMTMWGYSCSRGCSENCHFSWVFHPTGEFLVFLKFFTSLHSFAIFDRDAGDMMTNHAHVWPIIVIVLSTHVFFGSY